MRKAFFYDQARCMACNACSVACKDWNHVNPGPVRWRKVNTHEVVSANGAVELFNLAMSCNHCETPACKSACPAGAITQDADGLVEVDKDKCAGYKICITACPFANAHIADDKQEPGRLASWQINHPMQKCNRCKDRVAEGQKPICVMACPVFALDFDDEATIKANYPEAKQLNSGEFPYAYENNTTATGPAMYIKKRGTLEII